MLDRRHFLTTCSGFGLSSTLFPGTLWTLARDQGTVTKDMIEQAAIIADVPIPPEDRDAMVASLNQSVKGYDAIFALHMPNSVAPAIDFNPTLPSMTFPTQRHPMRLSSAPSRGVPSNLEDLAFASVRELAELVRTRKVSSTALTEMYLTRLQRLDPTLHFVITLTADRARAQARDADREIAAGKYRGPLHGLPWGAKDLLAVKGYRTTWGAGGFEQQMIDEDAAVVKRLDEAGAVLIAKLTLGALALGDRWFDGITRNPWRPAQGSSGSSAGPASATAAGCVAFSIGSETLGSISSPSTRCGCTGLRPTFGRVPRTGAMALSWSMDKLGPICRSVEDCAIVLDAIYGPDGHDRTVHAAAFNWDAQVDVHSLRVGYLKTDFENDPPQLRNAPPPAATDTTAQRQRELLRTHITYDRHFEKTALEKIAAMGVTMTPVQMPDMPWQAMTSLLDVEAAAAFDELTRTGRDKLLTEQSPNDWPNTFRAARLTPAVEYVQANRARMLAIQAMAKVFDAFDVIVAPTGSTQLVITNLTGHPAVIVPNGIRGEDAPPYIPSTGPGVFGGNWGGPGTPVSLTFLGPLYGEAKMLAFARAYQEATGFHRQYSQDLMRVAALYDIHGNQPALDAVLAVADADEFVIGGDIVLGGNSREALDRVMSLGSRAHVIRGNCDRLVVDAFDGRPLPARLPSAVQDSIVATARQLGQHHRDYLAGLPETLVLGSVLFCHATPRNDDEIFAVDTPADIVRHMFAGVTQPLAVCGHTHVQFDRVVDRLRIVNAGSIGMPLGPPGAYWLLLDPDVHLMRTDVP